MLTYSDPVFNRAVLNARTLQSLFNMLQRLEDTASRTVPRGHLGEREIIPLAQTFVHMA
jgi:hypothetical protein